MLPAPKAKAESSSFFILLKMEHPFHPLLPTGASRPGGISGQIWTKSVWIVAAAQPLLKAARAKSRRLVKTKSELFRGLAEIQTMKKFKNAPVKIPTASGRPLNLSIVKSELPKAETVSFQLVKPEAKRVCVAGSFNDWQPEIAPLAPMGDGRWGTDLALKPGRHEYLFVVDGQWMPDPNAKESVQNPFGGRNSILGVSE